VKRILLVEDEAIVRTPVAALLERQGYLVDCASTEEEALALAKAAIPDLVVCDVHLEKGSGVQVCERLRATPRFERIPIMMLTGDSKRETVMRCVAAGANDYYLKSGFDLEALLSRVRKWIGGPALSDDPVSSNEG